MLRTDSLERRAASASQLRGFLLLYLLLAAALACAPGADSEGTSRSDVEARELADEYIRRFLKMHPTRATAAGWSEADRLFEDYSPDALSQWSAYNAEVTRRAEELLAGSLDLENAADLRLLSRQAAKVVLDLEERRLPATFPLFWTRVLGNSGVFLLVRTDRALTDRLDRLAERAEKVPAFVEQALQSFEDNDPAQMSAEIVRIAARQARASASFYADAVPAASREAGVEPSASFVQASEACARLADRLDSLAERARGSVRMGRNYRKALTLMTGEDRDPADVMAAGLEALAAKRVEAAEFGRSIWSDVMDEDPPTTDQELVEQLFERIGEDRAGSVEEFILDYRTLVDEIIRFVTDRDLLTLPQFSLITDRSPDYFVGQSVGGVYSPGPFAPEGETLFYLPTPPPNATPEQQDALFRDFNHHFNVMIVPHEIVPGHDTHLRWAALHPSKVRSLFADAVTTEGWGTYSERLLLDLGWGDELARVAHLKKQMENIARTVVDIGVHTEDWPRDEVLDFVQNEALQDVQFAVNMWNRSLTTAPQLTSYWLGYERFRSLYEEALEAEGESFELKAFLDRVMQVAPVGGEDLRALVLASP
ncbi:MAG: DUF885 family protein [Acidobacteriota bacterium]